MYRFKIKELIDWKLSEYRKSRQFLLSKMHKLHTVMDKCSYIVYFFNTKDLRRDGDILCLLVYMAGLL